MEAGGTHGNATVRRALEHHFIQKTLKCATIGMMWFPVVFVVGLTIYAYYVYVVEYCSMWCKVVLANSSSSLDAASV